MNDSATGFLEHNLRGIHRGVLLLLVGLNWIREPSLAAENLGMTLPSGLARSTMIGDMAAFFLSSAAFVLLGAATGRARWLCAAGFILGLAARTRFSI